MDEEIRVLGYCVVCGNEITDEEESYVDSDGNYYCSTECVLEYFDVTKIE